MTEPLVTQLRFTRSELARCLQGVSAEDAQRRLKPMNSISWLVGHLASQEQFLWLERAQGTILSPELYRLVGYGQPATTPPLEEMWHLWREITQVADQYLATLTPEMLRAPLFWQNDQTPEDVGTSLLRNIYHYWFHIGEAHAIRQMLGHDKIPQFVGDLSAVRYASVE